MITKSSAEIQAEAAIKTAESQKREIVELVLENERLKKKMSDTQQEIDSIKGSRAYRFARRAGATKSKLQRRKS